MLFLTHPTLLNDEGTAAIPYIMDVFSMRRKKK